MLSDLSIKIFVIQSLPQTFDFPACISFHTHNK